MRERADANCGDRSAPPESICKLLDAAGSLTS
jgi:hypothetical protein